MMKMFLNFINSLKRLKDHPNLDSLKTGVGLIKIMQKFVIIIIIIALVYLIYKFILTDMFYNFKLHSNLLQRAILNCFKNFQAYIDSLSKIRLLSLMNLICLGAILYLFTSLVTILLGHKLIQRMILEERFVKLAKYLNFKKTFLSYNLITLIILIYIVSITYFIINLLIFIQFH